MLCSFKYATASTCITTPCSLFTSAIILKNLPSCYFADCISFHSSRKKNLRIPSYSSVPRSDSADDCESCQFLQMAVSLRERSFFFVYKTEDIFAVVASEKHARALPPSESVGRANALTNCSHSHAIALTHAVHIVQWTSFWLNYFRCGSQVYPQISCRAISSLREI